MDLNVSALFDSLFLNLSLKVISHANHMMKCISDFSFGLCQCDGN